MTTVQPIENVDTSTGTIGVASPRFPIPGDTIARTCESLTDDQRREIKWAAGYCRDRRINCEEFGGMLRQPGSEKPYSKDSVYAVFTGRREDGSVERFCESVSELRKRVEETAPHQQLTFVETTLSRAMWRTFETALRKHKLSYIFGPSQIGKTVSGQEYARRHNHGETVLVRMPTRGAIAHFMDEMAIRLGFSPQTKVSELRRRIIESFDDRMLLIVDECHECMLGGYGTKALATLDFIREIYDRRKCGVVLIGTDVFLQGLRSNKVLRQLWLRGYRPLQLPATPSNSTLADFALAFGLDPAPDRNINVTVETVTDDGDVLEERVPGNPIKLQTQVMATYGLGRWLSILEDAAESAKAKSSRITWARVIAAHHELQKVEEGKIK